MVRRLGLGLSLLLIVLFGLYRYTHLYPNLKTHLNSLPKGDEWPMFRRDLSHTGNTDPRGAVAQGTVKWVFSSGGAIHSSGAIAKGIVYFGSRDGKLHALSAETGTGLWEFQTVSWVESSPAISYGVVYFGSNDGEFYALDALNGKKLWSFKARYSVRSSPAVAGDKVFFGSDDYFVYSLGTKKGNKIWTFETNGFVSSSPAVVGGILYIGSMDGHLYALNAHNGRPRLKFNVYAPVVSSPSVGRKVVYVNNASGRLNAIDGTATNWFLETKIYKYLKVLHLYGDLPKLPLPSGHLWSRPLGPFTGSSPLLVEDRLYIGVGSGLLAMNLSNKELLWEFRTGGAIISSPALSGTALYVGSNDGHVYALETRTGKLLWKYGTDGKITASPTVADGTVFIGSHDGKFYALE
jgi:outer membrane protein assembly factor BamB